jgi:hypothetical protein
MDRSDGKTRKKTSTALEEREDTEIKRGSTTSHSVENWLWKRLWTNYRTDCRSVVK